jgi:hypothetical protein
VRILLRQPVAYGAHVAGNVCCYVCLVMAFFVQNADGESLLLAQVAVRVLVVDEQRRRRRRRRRGRGCCSCSGRMAVLLIVTVAALAAVLVLHSFPCLAQRAEELQIQQLNRHEQAVQHTNTAACKKGAQCTSSLFLSASLRGN